RLPRRPVHGNIDGAGRAQFLAFQSWLLNLGYYYGSIDGVFRPGHARCGGGVPNCPSAKCNQKAIARYARVALLTPAGPNLSELRDRVEVQIQIPPSKHFDQETGSWLT